VTPERLARAGAELADEVGFDQVTVSELARQFDVKVASLYSHVKNSQDLKTRIALLALEELADRSAAALAGRAGQGRADRPGERLPRLRPRAPRPVRRGPHAARPEAAAASAGPRHAQMTRAILRGYDLSEPDQTHAVRLLGSVFHGYVSLELAGGFSHSAPTRQQSWTRIMDGLDALLRNWPSSNSPLRLPR
jgi:AcrR family transcriptional regulator